jgi:hypothetical protein
MKRLPPPYRDITRHAMPPQALWLPLLLFVSCGAASRKETASAAAAAPSGPQPAAIVRAGEQPLWFQLTGAGPAVLETIEDARFSAALIPWPLALHIRFILCRGEELLLAINREGCIRLAPWDAGGLGLYRYPGGDEWERSTLGGFALYDNKPAALLYLDDRFLDTGAAPPARRLWTFSGESGGLAPLSLPALDAFPPEEGWNADTLRLAPDGYWYYRLFNRTGERGGMLMFRSPNLAEAGEEVSLGQFQNSAAPEPAAAAPGALREALDLIFAFAGGGTVYALSPAFPQGRAFAAAEGGRRIAAWWGGGEDPYPALALFPDGAGLRITPAPGGGAAGSAFTLPPLPGGFVYTGIALAGDAIFAAWEEQAEHSTGAAGFLLIKGGAD